MNAHSLFGVETRNRPKYSDDAVVALAAKLCADALLENHSGDFDEEDRNAIEADLRHALKYQHDGYDIARDLEGRGWDIDASIVETLDGWWGDTARRQRIREWVQEQHITPSLAIGAEVQIRANHFESNQMVLKDGTGVITAINAEDATYTVRVESWGHVKEGLGTHGIILPFEDVEALNPPPEVAR